MPSHSEVRNKRFPTSDETTYPDRGISRAGYAEVVRIELRIDAAPVRTRTDRDNRPVTI